MTRKRSSTVPILLTFAFALGWGCVDNPATVEPRTAVEDGGNQTVEHPSTAAIYDFANQCVVLKTESGGATTWLRAEGEGYRFAGSNAEGAGRFFLKASDLGTYLLYDADGGYLVGGDDGSLLRQTTLESDIYRLEDGYVSGAEWELEFSQTESFRYVLRNRRTRDLLGVDRLVDNAADAAGLVLEETDGCTAHPEMSLDATGTVDRTRYDDGMLYGFVDTHSHILTNFGFGGGGIFHGAPFHRLGVAHAMGDCELFHGEDGRADLLGWDGSEGGGDDSIEILRLLKTGRLSNPAHATDGWPTFSDWPDNANATHQTQYYRWLERAWLGGLRLMVQHAVSNSVFCELMANTEFQPVRWDCNDMVNIDRQLVEIRRMERYIDAQSGGPGEGWFRIVESPAQAREVIAEGKLAIVLGIEVPNLFDCFLTPRPGAPTCDRAHIESQLDLYYDKGVRALFPNHKYDNAFTPGDGDRGIVELGNFLNTSHWSNFVQDCPEVPSVFDRGPVHFGGLNQPRDEYLAAAPYELIVLTPEPLDDLRPFFAEVSEPALEGDWCQKATLTDAGYDLVNGIIARGMILEIDHLPRRSYLDVFELIEALDYPAAGTHGNTNDWKLYELGGVSKANFGRCADPAEPGSMARRFRDHRDNLEAAGQLAAVGFGFDFNGLGGVNGPRFGEGACAEPQENPVEYPFDSVAGDVTFTQPQMGTRVVDYNTEGMFHIGLAPELIEDARRTGVTDEDLEILFRSAEAYIRMWERAERRSRELRDGE